ncbi:MAG: signal recognition particle-docking protein FtsY [Pseudomonadota bacterium]|nr:signal recognition particle-docking protein FtsY [Pseudomonadota bacterium]
MTNVAEEEVESKKRLLDRVRQGLGKTRSQLMSGLEELFLGEKAIDQDLLEQIENTLLQADVGVSVTNDIIENLTQCAARDELGESKILYDYLRRELTELLVKCEEPLTIGSNSRPFVILAVGVNGAGKTTTIGKLACYFKDQGFSVLLAAGDTFRAAAVEQLQTWGDRNQVPVIAQAQGSDSASVIYDAMSAAKAREIDIVIADTAGRLHSKKNLMEELSKITRVLKRHGNSAPNEVLLVVDAGTGQNALIQAREFLTAVSVSGIVLTKLDGTAKGGVIFAIAKELGLPIRFIGVGERVEDLRAFSAEQFVEALIGH